MKTIKKSLLTSTVLLFSCGLAFGQISTREEPISFSRTNVPALRASERTQKVLPPLDMEKKERKDREDAEKGRPPGFGYKHKVNYTLENSGEWTELPDGGKLWRLSISCPGALSINLLYDRFWLPHGAKFWVYSADRKHSIGAFTSANNKGDRNNARGFATELVYGDRVTLEYWLPNDVKEADVISVSGIFQGYRHVLPQNVVNYNLTFCEIFWRNKKYYLSLEEYI